MQPGRLMPKRYEVQSSCNPTFSLLIRDLYLLLVLSLTDRVLFPSLLTHIKCVKPESQGLQ